MMVHAAINQRQWRTIRQIPQHCPQIAYACRRNNVELPRNKAMPRASVQSIRMGLLYV